MGCTSGKGIMNAEVMPGCAMKDTVGYGYDQIAESIIDGDLVLETISEGPDLIYAAFENQCGIFGGVAGSSSLWSLDISQISKTQERLVEAETHPHQVTIPFKLNVPASPITKGRTLPRCPFAFRQKNILPGTGLGKKFKYYQASIPIKATALQEMPKTNMMETSQANYKEESKVVNKSEKEKHIPHSPSNDVHSFLSNNQICFKPLNIHQSRAITLRNQIDGNNIMIGDDSDSRANKEAKTTTKVLRVCKRLNRIGPVPNTNIFKQIIPQDPTSAYFRVKTQSRRSPGRKVTGKYFLGKIRMITPSCDANVVDRSTGCKLTTERTVDSPTALTTQAVRNPNTCKSRSNFLLSRLSRSYIESNGIVCKTDTCNIEETISEIS